MSVASANPLETASGTSAEAVGSVEAVAAPAPSKAKKVKFPRHTGLRAELNRRVDAYFTDSGLSRAAAGPAMWFKTLVLIVGLAASWTAIMVWATAWWHLAILGPIAGFFIAGIGFSVMHDGGHKAYSESGFWNRAMAGVLDLVGGSSYMWNFKHNVLHHTYPNVEGLDDDIEAQPFLRMAEGQRRRPWHSLQHWYLWAAYALLPVKWHFIDDYRSYLTGQISDQPLVRPKGWDLLLLFGGKAFFYTWVFVIPLVFLSRSPEWVIASYFIMAGVAGVTLGTVFQMAHCVQDVEFASIPTSNELSLPWAEHQLATTANFCPKNPFLTWYLGGLNYQVEHHLFPRVGHIHYPAITGIVQEVCAEFGVQHRSNPTLWKALRSHVLYLKSLGRDRPATLEVAPL
ncbi:MAG: acyl-CoA desaturase [Planctomycetes bacterium]|nr:acyl-CoA desaturase [Planctomycetota bacterium]